MLARAPRLRKLVALLVAVSAVGAAVYWDAYHFEPYFPRLYRVPVVLPRLPVELDGVRIVVLGDLHLVRAGPREERMLALVRRARPDVVAIVGDCIQDDGVTPGPQSPVSCARELEKVLQRVEARLGKVACLGNWDFDPVPEVLRRTGFRLVEDGPQFVGQDGRRLAFVSTSALTEPGSSDLRDQAGAIVVLNHVPESADRAAQQGADLILSGHWHGGQVCLPFVGTLGAETARYPLGLYAVGDAKLYVTRGVGFHSEPVRFFCRSEVSLLTLRATHETDRGTHQRPGDPSQGGA